jgi:hypothetical protein
MPINLNPHDNASLGIRLSVWSFLSSKRTIVVNLFESGIVVKRRIDRNWRCGLEIPFDKLMHLAAVENYFWADYRFG